MMSPSFFFSVFQCAWQSLHEIPNLISDPAVGAERLFLARRALRQFRRIVEARMDDLRLILQPQGAGFIGVAAHRHHGIEVHGLQIVDALGPLLPRRSRNR